MIAGPAAFFFSSWPGLLKRLGPPEAVTVNPLVLPARLCGAAAGNRSHRYIGKVSCLLLVRAGRAPGRGPEGTGNCSSCYGDGQSGCMKGRAKRRAKRLALPFLRP